MKAQRLPKHVKAGRTIQKAREYVAKYSDGIASVEGATPLIQINTHNHGRDVCGNGTARYTCTLVWPSRVVGPVFYIVESGSRREQVGYSGANEAALWALGLLGFKLDESQRTSYDYQGSASYPVLNWRENN